MCPSGFKVEDMACTGNVNNVFCLAFDKNEDSFFSNGIRFEGNAQPTYHRGLWFDGDDAYLSSEELKLNTQFSVQLWVRASGNGPFFSS